MPYEHAIQTASDIPFRWAVDVLEGLSSLISTVRPHEASVDPAALSQHLDGLIDRFPKDYERLHDVSGLLFDPDIAAYGARTTAVFNRWDQAEGGGPVLPVFLTQAIERFQLPRDGPEVRAAMMAAVLAEIPNDLLYHGNEHYRKVMFHTIRLLAVQRQQDFADQPALSDQNMMQMLIAATIHDLGHEGGDIRVE